MICLRLKGQTVTRFSLQLSAALGSPRTCPLGWGPVVISPILPFELKHHSKGHSQQLKLTSREISSPHTSPPHPSHPPLNKPLLKGIFIPCPPSPAACCITLITSYETTIWRNCWVWPPVSFRYFKISRCSFASMFNFFKSDKVLSRIWSGNQSHHWKIQWFQQEARERIMWVSDLFSWSTLINGLSLLDIFSSLISLSTFQTGHNSNWNCWLNTLHGWFTSPTFRNTHRCHQWHRFAVESNHHYQKSWAGLSSACKVEFLDGGCTTKVMQVRIIFSLKGFTVHYLTFPLFSCCPHCLEGPLKIIGLSILMCNLVNKAKRARGFLNWWVWGQKRGSLTLLA